MQTNYSTIIRMYLDFLKVNKFISIINFQRFFRTELTQVVITINNIYFTVLFGNSGYIQ